MPRHSRSKLQGILEMPGFKGYPTGGNMESGFASEFWEDIKPFEIPQSRIMPKLNNGRRWVHPNQEMPLHTHDKSIRLQSTHPRLTMMNAFPQSKPTGGDVRANNSETASYLNPKSVPYYEDLADAQQQADVQRALADASHEEGYGKAPTLSELKAAGKLQRKGRRGDLVRLSEKKPIEETVLEFAEEDALPNLMDFFRQAKEVQQKEKAVHLMDKGFTEDQITEYFRKQAEKDIEVAAKAPISDNYSAMTAMLAIKNGMSTGTDAAGITPLGATQTPGIVASTLKNMNRPGLFKNIQVGEKPASYQQPATEIAEVASVANMSAPSLMTTARKTKLKVVRKKVELTSGQPSILPFLQTQE